MSGVGEFFTVLHIFLPESTGIWLILVDSGNSVEWKFQQYCLLKLLFPFHGIPADSRMAMESPKWNQPAQNPQNFF